MCIAGAVHAVDASWACVKSYAKTRVRRPLWTASDVKILGQTTAKRTQLSNSIPAIILFIAIAIHLSSMLELLHSLEGPKSDP